MRDDFRVRFGDEAMIGLSQAVFQLKIVFDDAVVNDDDAPRAVAVWMRVLFRRTPVRGPARMADAVSAVEWRQADRLFQIAELALGAANLKVVAFVNDRDASRIVAAIFEFTQPVNDDGYDLLVTNISNNATHKEFLCSIF